MPGFALRDQRNVDGIGFVRALGTLLTSHLEYFSPVIRSNIEASLEKECKSGDRAEGKNCVNPILSSKVNRVQESLRCKSTQQ